MLIDAMTALRKLMAVYSLIWGLEPDWHPVLTGRSLGKIFCLISGRVR